MISQSVKEEISPFLTMRSLLFELPGFTFIGYRYIYAVEIACHLPSRSPSYPSDYITRCHSSSLSP
jgi:hypothetical protein